jgi:hypothetical protein
MPRTLRPGNPGAVGPGIACEGWIVEEDRVRIRP